MKANTNPGTRTHSTCDASPTPSGDERGSALRRRLVPLGLLVLLLPPSAPASTREALPHFSNPRAITHEFWPFEAGRLLVSSDPTQVESAHKLHRYLHDSVTLEWNNQSVACSILREERFESGELVAWSETFVAQADDGSVYTFGEIADDEDDDSETGDDEDDDWVVGGELPGTQRKLQSVDHPLVMMPANTAVGSTWRVEVPPLGEERATIIRTGETLVTPAGTFTGCIQVLEKPYNNDEYELAWYAPNLGWVQAVSRTDFERLDRITTDLGRVDLRIARTAERRTGKIELSIQASRPLRDLKILTPSGESVARFFSTVDRGSPASRAEQRSLLFSSMELSWEELRAVFPSGTYRFVARDADSGQVLYEEVCLVHADTSRASGD